MEDLMSRFRLIVNPRARVVNRKYQKEKDRFWERHLEPGQYSVPETLDELTHEIRQIGQPDIKYLGILGGDGTIHQVITALINNTAPPYPSVLALRGGTMNSVANNVGQIEAPEKILEEFLLKLASGAEPAGALKYPIRVSEQPLEASSGAENQRTSYCFTFANGVIVRFFAEYYNHPNPGFNHAVRLLLRIFSRGMLSTRGSKNFLAPVEMEIRAGSQEVPSGKVNLVVASSLDNPVLWFRPFGQELNGRPQFHCIVNAMERKEIVRNMWDLFVGKCHHPLNWVQMIQEIEINSSEGYTMDGEVYPLEGPARINLSLGPGIPFVRG
jgi:diacylglycerol kinase family enzyme